MKTVACRIDLGYTRIAGYTLFDSSSLEFQETTPREVMSLIKSRKLNGLTFNSCGEIVPDLKGWNLGNIKIKSGVGNYRDFNDETTMKGTVYSVTRAIDINDSTRVYEVISHKCARIIMSEKNLLALSKLAWIGGIFVDEDTNEIKLCSGVKVEEANKDIIEYNGRVVSAAKFNESHVSDDVNGDSSADGGESKTAISETATESSESEPETDSSTNRIAESLEDLFGNSGTMVDVAKEQAKAEIPEGFEEPAVSLVVAKEDSGQEETAESSVSEKSDSAVNNESADSDKPAKPNEAAQANKSKAKSSKKRR